MSNFFRFLSIAMIIVFVILTPLTIRKLIKIEKVDCVNQYGECPSSLISSFEILINNNYDTSKKQAEQILKNNIQVDNYLIQYKIPKTLKIEIDLKKAKYAIKNKDEQSYIVDLDGLIIAKSLTSNLPTLIHNEAEYIIGQNINEKDKFALSLIDGVLYSYSINQGEIEGESLIVISKEGIKIIFPLIGDRDVLIGGLRLIFSRLNDGSEGIRINEVGEIDLRFRNPILRKLII